MSHERAKPEKRSDLVVIKTVQGEIPAEIIKAHLESQGITVLLKRESVGKVYGLITNGLGAVKILVPREFEEDAKEVVKEETSSD
jgi:hypothetical protein